MTQQEFNYIEQKVKVDLTPEIRSLIPSVLGWLLRAIFPKIEAKIIAFIVGIVEHFLDKRESTDVQAKGRCNKHAITDPHYGEAGDYDKDCNWIPWS